MRDRIEPGAPSHVLAGKRVWVAGHRGMVGAALLRRLAAEDCIPLTVARAALDLTDQRAVQGWMQATRPQVVILAAARVGGIHANDTQPVDFLYENLMIAANVIHAAHAVDVERLLFLGSSCIYPRLAPQPIPESSLLSGPLEPTNEWYAIAKIAGVKLVQAYRRQHGRDWISAMPTNIYGPGDNYDLLGAHVLPALLRRMHEAKAAGRREIEIWGTGQARREFLHCDDLADALVLVLKHYSAPEPINIGSGQEVSIEELARLIAAVVGHEVTLRFDRTRPDGTPRKILDATLLDRLGWKPSYSLREGIESTYRQAQAQGWAR